jgi:hypothetical protein
MKVDLNRRFRGFDGNELGGDNIATAVAEARAHCSITGRTNR